jgi:hypothetical protein
MVGRGYLDLRETMKQINSWEENELFRCRCYSPEHSLQFSLHKFEYKNSSVWEPALFIHVFLGHADPWWKRVWLGIKYIFGYRCKYGYFDETTIQHEDAERFLQLAQKYYDEVQKYVNAVVESTAKK